VTSRAEREYRGRQRWVVRLVLKRSGRKTGQR
jgi:hypothetical protein